jgi:hypothetical protein
MSGFSNRVVWWHLVVSGRIVRRRNWCWHQGMGLLMHLPFSFLHHYFLLAYRKCEVLSKRTRWHYLWHLRIWHSVINCMKPKGVHSNTDVRKATTSHVTTEGCCRKRPSHTHTNLTLSPLPAGLISGGKVLKMIKYFTTHWRIIFGHNGALPCESLCLDDFTEWREKKRVGLRTCCQNRQFVPYVVNQRTWRVKWRWFENIFKNERWMC